MTHSNPEKPDQDKTKIVSISSPIPLPEVLAEYEKISSGTADRIISLVEKEGEHRRELEKVDQEHQRQIQRKIVESDIVRSYLGLAAGFIIAIVGLGGSIYLGVKDKTWASGILGVGTLTGLVTVFVRGKEISNNQDENRKE